MQFTVLNSTSRFLLNRFTTHRLAGGLALATCLAAMLGAYWMQAGHAAAGIITGTVFQDYNSNGVRDTTKTLNNTGSGTVSLAIDRGIAGVTVTAYTASGVMAGSAVTDAAGNYSLNATGDAPYRIEFTDLPAGFHPGPFGVDSQTTVQFITDNNASNVSLGLVIPAEFSQDNPTLVTGCYVGGEQTTDSPVLISFPYSAGTTRETGGAPFTDFDQPSPSSLAQSRQIGTTWGLAYARSTRLLYAASFMKRHAGYGPAGTGAIYQVNIANGAISTYADLNAIFGANTAGANAHDPNDYDRDNGNVAWDAVGKTSLGGMAVSDDDRKLYVMNLADRQLYELPLDNTPSAATVRRQPVPLNPPGCSATSDVRPFAVAVNSGKIYVGMVCSAESTISQTQPNGDPSQMQAYVYAVDPTTLAFSGAPVFQASLNYSRRCADSAQLGTANCFSAAWRVWSPVYRNIGNGDGVGIANLSRGIFPQPWLTDLAFENGNLILGLRDRAGDQFGNASLDNPAEAVVRYYGVSAGDTLKACGSAATGWTLESNGRCGGAGLAPQNSGEGPGGGEFYFRDEAVPFTDEIFMGGLAQIPGHPDLVANTFDPIPIFDFDNLFDGGPRWLVNATGGLKKTYRIYNGGLTNLTGPFGKANGLSDVAVLSEAPPLEIGNRVWQDTNGNGIQEPNEPGIANVRVRLLTNGIQVGETMTNDRGEFYFNASNVSTGVLPVMNYEIVVERAQTALTGFTLTGENQDSSANGDIRDSDAIVRGVDAVIQLTTGGLGESNHTFDMGFVPPGGPITITCPPNVTATVTVSGANSAVVTYPTPTTTGQVSNVSCTPASGSTFPLGTTTVTCVASNSVGFVNCSFTVTVNQQQPMITCPINMNVTATTSTGGVVTYTTPTATNGATVTCAPPSGSTFPIGTTTVTCTATNSGGSASCQFTVTLTPQVQPPMITCPINMNVTATTSTGGVVTYTTPTATNGATVTCTPPSGSTFPIGTTTVTCTATNSAGSASCSFTVTLTPQVQPPMITCPINMNVTATTSTGGVVTYPTPTATNGATVTCTPPSGSTFPIGTTTVTCTATNSGGSASCQFTVTLTPQVQPPMITCPINMNVTATTSTGGVVTYTTPTATNGATVTCAPPSGSTFPIGTTTVNCTATNSVGSASCSFTVTLTQQVQPPMITCPINMNVTATTSTGGVVTYPTPTATNGATVTCTPPSGSTFPIGTTTVNCTATNSAGSASCSFTVTMAAMMAKSNKCDTICFRSPQYYLLNVNSLPGGTVLIGGTNNNQPVSTTNRTAIALALRGSATGFGLTPLQRLNQEFVAAQLSINSAGGSGSPVTYNVFWSMLNCYNINFASVTLSNGVMLSPASMLNELFDQAQLAIRQNRTADMAQLALIFDLLNGNDPLGRCGR